ncbi:cysteine dioxygenase [Variovorax ginsengisoli]|uniref:Metal-dependent enzyme (Double-stranded beta helix superfamily) n=1 Tax=Variovorax ginsengisoli TaxID=363844 RepID=A0ABT9S665_9BURK|nr:cysteine dioxygenase [Variovorax ginsengisoli]MDP9899850.1 putative metal-dependent enzyme (double-stranded beta helix superfamily) [Variovorax ginsengisoli]
MTATDASIDATDATRALAPLREFVAAFGRLLDTHPDEPRILDEGAALLRTLGARDDWLPDDCAVPDPERYQQFLLHVDAAARFSVVSFVWGPGQATPVHDHTVWGLIGMLRGAEYSQRWRLQDDGGHSRAVPDGEPLRLEPGQVEAVSPTIGDMHRVHNAHADRVSVSIHVYGADIGAVRRHTYPADGGRKPFVSGYSNTEPPTL